MQNAVIIIIHIFFQIEAVFIFFSDCVSMQSAVIIIIHIYFFRLRQYSKCCCPYFYFFFTLRQYSKCCQSLSSIFFQIEAVFKVLSSLLFTFIFSDWGSMQSAVIIIIYIYFFRLRQYSKWCHHHPYYYFFQIETVFKVLPSLSSIFFAGWGSIQSAVIIIFNIEFFQIEAVFKVLSSLSSILNFFQIEAVSKVLSSSSILLLFFRLRQYSKYCNNYHQYLFDIETVFKVLSSLTSIFVSDWGSIQSTVIININICFRLRQYSKCCHHWYSYPFFRMYEVFCQHYCSGLFF
jgi:hypothetical protein